MKETKEQREERKSRYIAYVLSKNTAGADEKQIIKEAGEKWEKQNGNNTKR